MRIVGQLVMYLVYIQYIAVHEAYQSSDWPKDPRLQSPCESESRLQRIMATTTANLKQDSETRKTKTSI